MVLGSVLRQTVGASLSYLEQPPVRPYVPFPPEPVKRIDVWGIPNGLFRLTFLAVYFGLVALNLKHMGLDASVFQLLGLHALWALMGIHAAVHTSKVVVDRVNEERGATYLRVRDKAARAQADWDAAERHAAELAQPIEGYRPDLKTGRLEEVRRPLLDARMGLTVRD